MLINSESLSIDRRSSGREVIVKSIAVSSNGVIAYSIMTNYTHRQWYSLYIFDKGRTETVIFESQDIIAGLTFLKLDGTEHLLFLHQPNIVMLDEQLTCQLRTLHGVKHESPLSSAGPGQVYYVQPTQRCTWGHGAKVACDWELWQLEIRHGTGAAFSTKRGLLKLGWKYVSDMCIIGQLIVLCSHKDGSVAGAGLTDCDTKWNVSLHNACSVCPGIKNSIFLACSGSDFLLQLSMKDGSTITQLPLTAVKPPCVRYQNNVLYVPSMTTHHANLMDTQDNCWEVLLYKLNPSKAWILTSKMRNAWESFTPQEPECPIPLEPEFKAPTLLDTIHQEPSARRMKYRDPYKYTTSYILNRDKAHVSSTTGSLLMVLSLFGRSYRQADRGSDSRF